MAKIEKKLFEQRDEKYAKFQSKLIPGIDESSVIGVRIPLIRKLAKEYFKLSEHIEFMQELPHTYYEENLLHGCLIEQIREYDECITELELFLPFVDNWAVCDTMSPKLFKRHKEELVNKIYEWTASDRLYTVRFALKMLMTHYLDEDFKHEYLEIPAGIHSEEYYLKMMQAWFFATALAKQWEETLPYLTENKLERWVHNKTIQKAVESYRITPEQKKMLRTLKIC